MLLIINVYKDLSLCMTMFGSRHTIHCWDLEVEKEITWWCVADSCCGYLHCPA